jgi:uncharacterized membrane protein YraQ (UPF0718 family)
MSTSAATARGSAPAASRPILRAVLVRAFLVVVPVLAVVLTEHRWDTARTFAVIFAELLVLFLVVSTGVALAQRVVGPARLQSWMGGGTVVGTLKGIALGAATPFCSCSTVPVLVGLLRARVPVTSTTAFLIASPLVDPFVFGAIWLLFGLREAIVFTALAVLGTLAAAALARALRVERFLKRFRVEGDVVDPEPWRGWSAELPTAGRVAVGDLRAVLVPLVLGVSVGALIYGAVPTDLLAQVAGPESALAVPVAALLSVPVYLRAETALPIGLALLNGGMGLGPVFAFVVAGAGISLPEMAMLTAVFRRRLLVGFAATVMAVAISAGYLVPLLA